MFRSIFRECNCNCTLSTGPNSSSNNSTNGDLTGACNKPYALLCMLDIFLISKVTLMNEAVVKCLCTFVEAATVNRLHAIRKLLLCCLLYDKLTCNSTFVSHHVCFLVARERKNARAGNAF